MGYFNRQGQWKKGGRGARGFALDSPASSYFASEGSVIAKNARSDKQGSTVEDWMAGDAELDDLNYGATSDIFSNILNSSALGTSSGSQPRSGSGLFGASSYSPSNWGTRQFGPTGGIGGDYIGDFGKTKGGWTVKEFGGFSPMGAQVMGNSERGMKFKKGSSPWKKASAEFETRGSNYLGPTYTGGWRKDYKEMGPRGFTARKRRLKDTDEWDFGMTDPSITDANPIKTYRASADLGEFTEDDFAWDPGTGGSFETKPMFAKSSDEIVDAVKREFGTSDIDDPIAWGESEEFKDIRDTNELVRDPSFGALYNPEQNRGVEEAESALRGFGDHIKPGGEGGNIFDFVYHSEDDPNTVIDETKSIDWNKTAPGGMSVAGLYTDVADDYFKDVPGWSADTRGKFMEDWLGIGENIGGIRGVIGQARDTQDERVAADTAVGQLLQDYKAQGDDVRAGLLSNVLESDRKRYSSGMQGSGEDVFAEQRVNELLSSGQAGLVQGKQGIVDARKDVETATAKEMDLMAALKTPSRLFEDRFRDMQSEYGTRWETEEPAWESEFWSDLQSSMGFS